MISIREGRNCNGQGVSTESGNRFQKVTRNVRLEVDYSMTDLTDTRSSPSTYVRSTTVFQCLLLCSLTESSSMQPTGASKLTLASTVPRNWSLCSSSHSIFLHSYYNISISSMLLQDPFFPISWSIAFCCHRDSIPVIASAEPCQ